MGSGGSYLFDRLLPAALILYSWLSATSTGGILNLLPYEFALYRGSPPSTMPAPESGAAAAWSYSLAKTTVAAGSKGAGIA